MIDHERVYVNPKTEFSVSRPGRETAGYVTDVALPDGVSHVSSRRDESHGVGGFPVVTDTFICDDVGEKDILFRTKRPWSSDDAETRRVIVICMRREEA